MRNCFNEQELRAAQICFSLASQLIYREPQREYISQYIEHDVFADAPFGMENTSVVRGLALLKAWCDHAVTAKEKGGSPSLNEEISAIKNEWLALFIGYGTPQAPSWEAYYRDINSPLMGSKTLEVRSWYRKYGLQIKMLHKEPDDNLGLMLGFLSHLLGLEADALSSADVERATTLALAQKDFLSDHILPWLAAWRFNVREHAHSEYFRGTGDLVFGLLEELANRFSISFNEEKEIFVVVRQDA